jgi:VanZ family protein
LPFALINQPRTTNRLWLWAPVAVYMAAIFVVSGQTDPATPAGLSDKSLHGLAYFGLAVLVFRAIAGRLPARLTWRAAVAALAISIGYGITDELHQLYVPGRSADVFDLFADAIGAASGLIGCWAWGIISIRSDV